MIWKTETLAVAVTTAGLVFGVGCAGAEVTNQGADAPMRPAAAPATADAIPAQTVLQVRLDEAIGSQINQVGDNFTVIVEDAIVARNGDVAVPAGAKIKGEVTEVKRSSGVGEQAAIGVAFTELSFDGESYPLSAEVLETEVEQDRSDSSVAKGAGAGAVAGGILGAILGGGSGALKGGLAGAVGGTLIGLGTGDVDARIPAGSFMTLRLTERVPLEPAD